MTESPNQGQSAAVNEPLGVVAKALDSIRFGAILLTIHNGQITQLDVTERRRFSS